MNRQPWRRCSGRSIRPGHCGSRSIAPEWGDGAPRAFRALAHPGRAHGAGPSTPALAAAVSDAGGLGFLAGAYLTAEAMEQQIGELRDMTAAPFGMNIFVPQSPDV